MRRNGLNYAGIRGCGRGNVEGRTPHKPRISGNVGRNGDLFLVIAQPVTAADHESVVESSRTPGNTDLGPEVTLLRVPRISLPNGQASHVIRPCAREGHKHVALLGGERTKVGPAKAEIDGQVRSYFEIVLDKEAPDVFAVVLAKRRRYPGAWIEAPPFTMRRI